MRDVLSKLFLYKSLLLLLSDVINGYLKTLVLEHNAVDKQNSVILVHLNGLGLNPMLRAKLAVIKELHNLIKFRYFKSIL